MTAELVHSIPVANVLGEGVLWNERRRSVWWTDIERAKLFEYDPVSDALKTWDAPHRVACFGFVEDEDRLIVAFDRGIALYDPPSGKTDWLVQPDIPGKGLRFNDGKVDPKGRFWVGSMVEDASIASTTAALYCLDPADCLVERIRGIGISNGLCWSPDGTVMYHADSPTGLIRAYGFDPDRTTLSDSRVFAAAAHGVHPDGSTVDSDGGVWSAQWGGSQVIRYTPDGQVSQAIDLPVSQPTCVTFGGEKLDLLFVTSARAGLSSESLGNELEAGNVFVYQTTFTGSPASRLKR